MTFSTLLPSLGLSIRAQRSAAGLAVAIAQLLQLQYPLYAMISAIIVTDLSPSQTRQLGFQRLAGTVLGATVGATLTHILPSGPWAIGLSILAAMFLSPFASTGRGQGNGICLRHRRARSCRSTVVLCALRLIDTVLGIGVALLVSFVPKPRKDLL